MANRSYLYSTDSLPTVGAAPKPVRCISEHNSNVPLAHKLLVGRATAVVPSMIWSLPIGIAGDFAGGADLLGALLQAVTSGAQDDSGLLKCVDKTLAHLRKQQGKFLLLETGEIVSLYADDAEAIEAAVQQLATDDIPDAVAQAEAAIAGNNDRWLEAVREDWEEHFASFYSDVLYFSFVNG